MTCVRALLLAFWMAAGVLPAGAVQPGEQLADPALEERARDISAGLRCLVCQNQSIDDSDASLARDLRLLVRERLAAGDSDPEVQEYLVARYGDFILLQPPVRAGTLLLWLTPILVLVVGALIALGRAKRLSRQAVERLSPEEEQRVARMLGGE